MPGYNPQWYRVSYFDHKTDTVTRANLHGRTEIAEWKDANGRYILNEDDRNAVTIRGGAFNSITYHTGPDGELHQNRNCTYRTQSRWQHMRVVAIPSPERE